MGLAVWRSGCLWAWRLGGLAAWVPGGLAAWVPEGAYATTFESPVVRAAMPALPGNVRASSQAGLSDVWLRISMRQWFRHFLAAAPPGAVGDAPVPIAGRLTGGGALTASRATVVTAG